MKKTYFIVIVLLAVSTTIQAQIKFGAKAGVTSASINADQTIEAAANENYDELKVQGQEATINGFQAGLFGRISIASLYVQPELLFSRSVTEVKIEEITGEDVQKTFNEEQKFSKLDIPLMAGWKIGPARLQLGPVASIILANKSAFEAIPDAEEEFNGATWGYQVGAGLDLFNTLTLDVKYEGSLSKFGDGVVVGGEERPFDSRPNQFIFSLGIFF